MNHWAYDAIGQLAAHGILSGYPDGTYKGQQQTTRYEMASALARALAVVDMTKASKQDVEMLKRLVVEFKDELEALGVRVDELDDRVAVIEERLGGWHIHGVLDLDTINRSAENAASKKGDGSIGFDAARLFFERTWGDDGEYFFRARLRNDDTAYSRFDRFYVEMPFFFDSRLLVGRQNWDLGTDYRLSLPETGSWTGDSVLTDITWTGLALTKNFGLGTLRGYLSHNNRDIPGFPAYEDGNHGINAQNWEVFLEGSFNFTEQIGLDIGGQAFVGDNAETPVSATNTASEGDRSFNSLWTVFAGLRFSFNDSIALKGIFYHQEIDSETVRGNDWADYGYGPGNTYSVNGNDYRSFADGDKYLDDANHWAVMIDVKQEALKYTSVWLEYGQYDAGFWVPQGMSTIFPSESNVLKRYTTSSSKGNGQAGYDINYWRVALGQIWNEKWATHLFYYGYNIENAKNGEDAKPAEYGLGVQYNLNDYTKMGLNYVHVDNDQEGDNTEDNVIRFRTSIAF